MAVEEEDDDEITNETRAEWALKALKTHSGIVYEDGATTDEVLDDLETNAVDLLADVFHLLSQKGIDPNKVIDSAVAHFDEESGG